MADPAPAPAPVPRSKAQVFARRLLSTVVLWGIVLSTLFSGNKFVSDYVFLLIMVTLAGTGVAEFYGLVEKEGMVCFKAWGIFGGVLLMVGTFYHFQGKLGEHGTPARVNDFDTILLILF